MWWMWISTKLFLLLLLYYYYYDYDYRLPFTDYRLPNCSLHTFSSFALIAVASWIPHGWNGIHNCILYIFCGIPGAVQGEHLVFSLVLTPVWTLCQRSITTATTTTSTKTKNIKQQQIAITSNNKRSSNQNRRHNIKYFDCWLIVWNVCAQWSQTNDSNKCTNQLCCICEDDEHCNFLLIRQSDLFKRLFILTAIRYTIYISCCDPDFIKQNTNENRRKTKTTKTKKYELKLQRNRLKIQFVQTSFFNQTVYLKTILYNSAILMKFTEII